MYIIIKALLTYSQNGVPLCTYSLVMRSSLHSAHALPPDSKAELMRGFNTPPPSYGQQGRASLPTFFRNFLVARLDTLGLKHICFHNGYAIVNNVWLFHCQQCSWTAPGLSFWSARSQRAVFLSPFAENSNFGMRVCKCTVMPCRW